MRESEFPLRKQFSVCKQAMTDLREVATTAVLYPLFQLRSAMTKRQTITFLCHPRPPLAFRRYKSVWKRDKWWQIVRRAAVNDRIEMKF